MEQLMIKDTNWNLECLNQGKTFEEKRKDWQNATDEFISKWKNRTDYLESPEMLKQALDDYENWKKYYGSEGDELYYYSLKNSLNQNDAELKAKLKKIEDFAMQIKNSVQFFTLNISKISKELQSEFLLNSLLEDYKHFLEKLFVKSDYLLNEESEKILNLKSQGAYSFWVDMLEGFLSKEEKEVLNEEGNFSKKNFSEIMNLLSHSDKKIRDSAAKAFNEILDKHKEVAENELNAILQDRKVNDELRKSPRPDFLRHLADDMQTEVVDLLVEVVKENYSLSRRFYELKSKLLGVDKLEYHERNLEIGNTNKSYPYSEALSLVNKVFSNLDKEFSDILKKFVENSQIDVYPKSGKRHGAFCSYFLPIHPTYILLNHSDKLKDVLTIAHEAGHGINNEFIRKSQNSLNFGTPMSTAEVASTFMEDFVLEELMKDADDELKLSLIMQKLNQDISSIIRQVACDIFQRELHKEFREKGYLSYKEIGEIFKKNMKAYMGDFVEQSEGSQNWWIYWGHIRSYFYNYQYSSGLLISKFMQRKVKENPEFIEKVKEFLSSGLSDSPKNIFAKMGIDIADKTFWKDGLKEVEAVLEKAEVLARKLGKI